MYNNTYSKMLNNSDDDFMQFHLLFDSTDVVSRCEQWRQSRIDWNWHLLEMLCHTRGFQSWYHMSELSFNKSVDILRSDISVDVNQSIRSTSGNGPITPKMIVGDGLRFLGGELHVPWRKIPKYAGLLQSFMISLSIMITSPSQVESVN